MAKKKGGPGLLALVLLPLSLVVGLLLPLWGLLRASVWFHNGFFPPVYLSMAILVPLLGMGLYVYLGWVWRTWKGKKKLAKKGRRFSLRLALLLVGFYLGYSLVFLGVVHTKTEEVRGEYQSLHPLLRFAVGTVVLMDQNMIITDLSRTHEDYGDMGLTDKKNSLHYPQSDGWVHAVDLRTKDRPEWRNRLTETFLKAMGFNAHRHVGTEDHLHVSLAIPENPMAW